MVRFAACFVISTFAFACAAPASTEAQNQTTSNETEATSDADAVLDQLEDRINNCHRLSAVEYGTLNQYSPGWFDFSAQIYVYVSCSTSEDGIVSAKASLEQRAGYSTSDGAFTESAFGVEAAFNVPLKVVDLSGHVAFEQTVRTSNGVTLSSNSTSIGAKVEHDFPIAKVSGAIDFDGTSAKLTGEVEAPIEIPLAACNGALGTAGARLEITATPNHSGDAIDPAIKARASSLIVQNADNNWIFNSQDPNGATEDADQKACCQAQRTCD